MSTTPTRHSADRLPTTHWAAWSATGRTKSFGGVMTWATSPEWVFIGSRHCTVHRHRHTHTHASLIISMGGNRPLLLRVFTDALLRTACKLLSWSTGENTKTSAQRLSQYTLVTEDILLTRSNGWNMGFQHSIFRDTLYRLLMRFTGVNMPLMWFQHSIFRDTLLADCWWDSQV